MAAEVMKFEDVEVLDLLIINDKLKRKVKASDVAKLYGWTVKTITENNKIFEQRLNELSDRFVMDWENKDRDMKVLYWLENGDSMDNRVLKYLGISRPHLHHIKSSLDRRIHNQADALYLFIFQRIGDEKVTSYVYTKFKKMLTDPENPRKFTLSTIKAFAKKYKTDEKLKEALMSWSGIGEKNISLYFEIAKDARGDGASK